MATTIERFTVMKPVSSQYLAGTCTSDGDDCDKTIPQSTVVKPVCSKYRAQTCTSNDDDCDEGKHPVELDPQRMSVEPNSVSMEEITTSFRCGRCIDKGIKCDKLALDATGKEPCSECRQFAGADADPCVLLVIGNPCNPDDLRLESRNQRDEDFEDLDI
ncbi:hypothetical protein Q7P36_003833 [Cladosporium allicinum]